MERSISRCINWKFLAVLPLLSGAGLLLYAATSISQGVLFSLLGHLAYGFTLGSLSRWGLTHLHQYQAKRTAVAYYEGSKRGETN